MVFDTTVKLYHSGQVPWVRFSLGRGVRLCRRGRLPARPAMGPSVRLPLGRRDVRLRGGGRPPGGAQVGEVAGMPVGLRHRRHGGGQESRARPRVGRRHGVSHLNPCTLHPETERVYKYLRRALLYLYICSVDGVNYWRSVIGRGHV